MVQNRALQEDMSETAQDNLEHLRGVGVSKDITEMEGYEPAMRVGTENNFSRDFAAGDASRDMSTRESSTGNITDQLPDTFKEETIGLDGKVEKATPPSGRSNDPMHIVNAPASRINTTQVGLAANAARIIFDSPQRLSVIIVNRDQNNALFIGSSSAVSQYTGFVIDPGASMTMAISCELWGVSPSGATASVIEFIE